MGKQSKAGPEISGRQIAELAGLFTIAQRLATFSASLLGHLAKHRDLFRQGMPGDLKAAMLQLSQCVDDYEKAIAAIWTDPMGV
jgi:hypothetical protein